MFEVGAKGGCVAGVRDRRLSPRHRPPRSRDHSRGSQSAHHVDDPAHPEDDAAALLAAAHGGRRLRAVRRERGEGHAQRATTPDRPKKRLVGGYLALTPRARAQCGRSACNHLWVRAARSSQKTRPFVERGKTQRAAAASLCRSTFSNAWLQVLRPACCGRSGRPGFCLTCSSRDRATRRAPNKAPAPARS